MAPERKRSARDYEQALKRQELAAGRALVQALPAEGPPGARELAAARVAHPGLFDCGASAATGEQIEGSVPAAGPGPVSPGRPGRRPAPGAARGAGRFEAVRNAGEESPNAGGPPRPARRRT